MVELGRIEIMTKASLLSSHSAIPQEGHLGAVCRISGYLKDKHNSSMIFDPTYPLIDQSDFKLCDWKEFYGGATEANPPNDPKPLGKEVNLRLVCDSEHAGDGKTRWSHTGFFIFLNMATIVWLPKKQPTIETNCFGDNFLAMKIGM